jgi:peroxiredoxin
MNSRQILLFAILILSPAFLFAQDQFAFVKKGDVAPDFTITMQDGSTKQLSELKGKVVWLNFFATWCPPCRRELPELEKNVYKKYKNQNDFEILVIGREHDWQTVTKFKTDNNYILPFYPDPKRKIFSKYAKQNIPRNFIIDKNGRIAVVSTGFNKSDFDKIVTKVEVLLKK